MSNIFDMEVLMSCLTYQEKSLYGALAAKLVVFIPYFVYAAQGHGTRAHATGLFIFLTVTQVIFQGIVALTSRNRVTDERDHVIEARGFRAAYFVLVTGIIAVFILLWTGPSFSSILLINVLLAALVLAEVSKIVTQITLYQKAL